MAMMYQIIGQALDQCGVSDKYHPQDYLNFFCLGKRETATAKGIGRHKKTNSTLDNNYMSGVRTTLIHRTCNVTTIVCRLIINIW